MKHLRLLLGLGISAAFLWLAFRGVRFGAVGAALRQANYGWLVPAVALIVASLLLRAVRWRLLFFPTTGLRYGNVFGAMNAGYLVNTVLPARLGEVVRAVLIGHLERVRTARALSTVVVERVLDMLTTIIILALLIPFVPLPTGSALPLAAGATLAVGALVVMIVAGAMPGRTHRLADIALRRLPERWSVRLRAYLDSFLEGFAVLSNRSVALRLVCLSAVVWLTVALALYSVMAAFHLNLPPTAPMFVLALVSLAFVVPSSPGYVGVFHLAVVKALGVGFGVDPTLALSYAFVAHLVSFAPPTLLGAWFVWRSGSSLGRLVSVGRRARVAEPAVGEDAARPIHPALTRQ